MQPVRGEQGDMAAEEDRPASDPVRQPAQRNGQQQERRGGPEREQREPAVGYAEAVLQQEVDEGVADGGQAQQQGAQREPPHVLFAAAGRSAARSETAPAGLSVGDCPAPVGMVRPPTARPGTNSSRTSTPTAATQKLTVNTAS